MPRSLVVDVVNIVERRAAPANHQGVRFSVATNGKFTVATNRVLRQYLIEFGLTPSARTRVTVPPARDLDDAFAEFD